MSYFIKPGYRENPGPRFFLDDVTATRDIVFQPDVYAFAEWVARLTGADCIKDVGCGWADKLAGIHERNPALTFVGIDYGENIAYCQRMHDWGIWKDMNLETIEDGALVRERQVVICSDVIEHLVDPVPLVRALAGAKAQAVILSTPERDVQYGYDHMGPSTNLCHVREWNAQELKAFLESEGLTVDHIGLTRGSDQSFAMGTQLVVCH